MRLARFELRRFLRGRLTAAALVVLAVIPLLYGALYLAAFWDPYGNLDKIPVALVDEDRPAGDVHAGQDLSNALLDRHVFGWHVTDSADARRGLESGRYHLIFRIPSDFSAALAGNPDPARTPAQGRLEVVDNDATNYLSGLLARTAFTEIRAAAEHSAASKYFDRMLIGFTDLKAKTQEAADGAGQLAGGAGQAKGGADGLADGADQAKSGAGQLAAGLDDAHSGADRLAAGLATLDAGAAQLADGTAQAAAGGQLLKSTVDGAADRIEPVLRANGPLIAQAATAIADGADAIADNVQALPDLANQAVTRATAVRDQLDRMDSRDPAVRSARAAADAAVQAATAVRDKVNAAGLDQLRGRLKQVAADARQLAADAPHLADDVAGARAKVDAFAAGLGQLATGADRLHQGTTDAHNGAVQLSGGLYRLSTGAHQLDAGLSTLDDGAHRLAGGLSDLQSGADRLAGGLSDGARQIPGYDRDGIAARAGVLGDPVDLQRQVRNPAATYGVGFAPYFVGLALWVGAMIAYMVLRPLNLRHVLSGAPARRVALAGWLPGVVIGVAQAALLYTVLETALGLRPVHPVATLGYLLLTALAFTALVQWLGAKLGPAGRLAALALLMLQLTSSGGTYPVQTSPGFFAAIHPYLPMSYVVDGLRHLIDGGSMGTVTVGCLVLAGFAAGGVALTTLAARRSRVLTPRVLHPELTL
ncbi:MAG: ABC transporter permease [Actinobacteria bacterium 13_2_20CM_2_72_6]|nr:MAG: ABC transporter permease [Actinobacteria bacterium 13_2_20CM_2_72_6]